MTEVQPLVVTLAEAASLLGVARASAYRMVREDRFPVRTVKVGGKIMVSRRRLEEYVDGDEVAAS